MGREDREKASDVFNKTEFAFAKKTTFENAFPQIEDITVEVVESGDGVREWNAKRIYKKSNIGEYVNCHNSLCYNGGFSLGNIIRHMVRDKKTELETTEFCQGYEGSPKGRRKYRNCMNCFDIKVVIKYKDETNESEKSQ